MTTQTDLVPRPVDDDEPRGRARSTRVRVAAATAGAVLAAALFGGGFAVGQTVAADGAATAPQQGPLGQDGLGGPTGQDGQLPTPPDGFGAPTAPDGTGAGGTGTEDAGTWGSDDTDVA